MVPAPAPQLYLEENAARGTYRHIRSSLKRPQALHKISKRANLHARESALDSRVAYRGSQTCFCRGLLHRPRARFATSALHQRAATAPIL
jgi:hypothetical protein